jgi:dihydroorotate dehydrogenase (NAD+) catalytic subunit
MTNLSVQIGRLKLKNPVLTASGTYGYGTEYGSFYDVSKLGGIVTKTITLNARKGNPMPRIAETTAGLLNSIGLANVGAKRFVEDKLPALKELNTSVIVNIAGSTIKEYCEVVRTIQNHSRVDAIEINISCPNVKQGGLAFGTDPQVTKEVVFSVRQETDKPLIVKLTPNVTDIASIAVAAVEGGADGLSLINTVLGMGIDIQTRRPRLARVIGGLSGPAIKPIALAKVYQVAKAVDVPVIGMGGIMQWRDAVEFLMAGASAIQVGTLNFVNPCGVINIIEGLRHYCECEKISRITKLIGSLKDG